MVLPPKAVAALSPKTSRASLFLFPKTGSTTSPPPPFVCTDTYTCAYPFTAIASDMSEDDNTRRQQQQQQQSPVFTLRNLPYYLLSRAEANSASWLTSAGFEALAIKMKQLDDRDTQASTSNDPLLYSAYAARFLRHSPLAFLASQSPGCQWRPSVQEWTAASSANNGCYSVRLPAPQERRRVELSAYMTVSCKTVHAIFDVDDTRILPGHAMVLAAGNGNTEALAAISAEDIALSVRCTQPSGSPVVTEDLEIGMALAASRNCMGTTPFEPSMAYEVQRMKREGLAHNNIEPIYQLEEMVAMTNKIKMIQKARDIAKMATTTTTTTTTKKGGGDTRHMYLPIMIDTDKAREQGLVALGLCIDAEAEPFYGLRARVTAIEIVMTANALNQMYNTDRFV